MKITVKTSGTLMAAYVIATIMIIAIHYSTRGYALQGASVWSWNYLIQELVTNGLARCGVPFFAMISGFFLSEQLSETKSYASALFKKFSSLFIPYVLAATLIYLSLAFAKMTKGNMSLFDIKTAFNGIIFSPLSGQFWFLRDLCILVSASPFLFVKTKILGFALGIPLFFLWLLELQIAPVAGEWYILNVETLFFFYLGGQLSLHSEIIDRIADSKTHVVAATSLILMAVLITRIMMDPTINMWYEAAERKSLITLFLYKAAIVIGIINLIQISAFFHNHTGMIYASGLTFFAFLFHFTPLNIAVSFISDEFVAKEYGFYISFPAATIIVFSSAYYIQKKAPRLYNILCGNRSPGKALRRERLPAS